MVNKNRKTGEKRKGRSKKVATKHSTYERTFNAGWRSAFIKVDSWTVELERRSKFKKRDHPKEYSSRTEESSCHR
jgi:hypothetical protein